MIQYVKGDIFQSDCEVWVNPVNTVGVMGAGLAKKFKDRYPAVFKDYAQTCKLGVIKIGNVILHEVDHPKFIASFPTKKHWKDSSRLSYILLGLQSLQLRVNEYGIKSIAMPKIGCGLGGLDWEEVRPEIEKIFGEHPVRVVVYH